MGNSLLRDVRVDKTSSGHPIKIRRKSGATLADIEQMIDDGAKMETIDEIFIVGGTHKTTSDVGLVARWRKVVHISISLLVQVIFCNQNFCIFVFDITAVSRPTHYFIWTRRFKKKLHQLRR